MSESPVLPKSSSGTRKIIVITFTLSIFLILLSLAVGFAFAVVNDLDTLASDIYNGFQTIAILLIGGFIAIAKELFMRE